MKIQNPTATLVKYLVDLDYADLPKEVVEMSKKAILDFLGYSVIAIKEKPAKILFETAKEFGGKKESTIIGFGYKTSCLNAAFVNGAMGHMCELDDTHAATMSHVGNSVIAAALSVAERGKIDGKKLITAVVAGYEAAIRAGESVMPSHYIKGFHPTGTINTFGAAVAAGKLLELNSSKMTHALGISGTQAAGIFAHMKERAMTKDLNPGKAAMNGLYAAFLARLGFTGASDIFENEKGFCRLYSDSYNLNRLTLELGEKFKILEIAFKPYSSCRYCHAAIDAILELTSKYEISVNMLKKMIIKMYSIAAWAVDDPSPWNKGSYGPRYSVQFNAALTIAEKQTGLKKALESESYSLDKLNEPKIRRLLRKVVVVIDRKLDREFPRKWSTIVEIKTVDGKDYKSQVDFPKGEPENPMTTDELHEKFTILASTVFGERKPEQIIAKVSNLEKLGNVTKLTDLLSA